MTGGIGIVAMLFYPVGFVTVTPVTVALDQGSNLSDVPQFWAVVFASNPVGP